MIVFEDGISALVAQIPEIENFKPHFHWGDEAELRRYLGLLKQPYPLVWLLTGKETHDLKGRGEVTRNCRFILAVRETREDKLNDFRLRNSFEKYLNPLAGRLIEGLQKFSITSIAQELDYQKHPNYTDNGEQKTTDLWDACTLDCRVTMNNNCQNTIVWQRK